MVSCFRIFQISIDLKLEIIYLVVMTCCVLHNFLYQICTINYVPPVYLDVKDIQTGTVSIADRDCNNGPSGLWVGMNRNASKTVKQVWEFYVKYFQNEVAVEWHYNFV